MSQAERQSERQRFLDCFDVRYAGEAYGDRVTISEALLIAKSCYDERGFTGDEDPPDR